MAMLTVRLGDGDGLTLDDVTVIRFDEDMIMSIQ
jgi:hypothetical protein